MYIIGYAQSQAMPHSDFRWCKRKEINKLDFTTMTPNQDRGFIIECDLTYPSHLHNSQNSFPLAPQSLNITTSHLSPYAKGKTKLLYTTKTYPKPFCFPQNVDVC
jgi:hypothetical protein